MEKKNLISVKFCQGTQESPNPDLKAKDKVVTRAERWVTLALGLTQR